MKNLFRFLTLFGIATLIGMGIHNCTEIKNIIHNMTRTEKQSTTKNSVKIKVEKTTEKTEEITNEHRQGNVVIKNGGSPHNISGSISLVKPSKIYTVKYRIECVDGLDGHMYYTYKKNPDSDWSNKIIHFGPNSYPPQINSFIEVEFKVKPPFTAQTTCYSNNDNKEILTSIFVDDNLVCQKVVRGYYKEIVSQIN